jgi:hypothetical protein
VVGDGDEPDCVEEGDDNGGCEVGVGRVDAAVGSRELVDGKEEDIECSVVEYLVKEAVFHPCLEDRPHLQPECFETIDLLHGEKSADEIGSAEDGEEEDEGLAVADEGGVSLEEGVGAVGVGVAAERGEEGEVEVLEHLDDVHEEVGEGEGDDVDVHVHQLHQVQQHHHRIVRLYHHQQNHYYQDPAHHVHLARHLLRLRLRLRRNSGRHWNRS